MTIFWSYLRTNRDTIW